MLYKRRCNATQGRKGGKKRERGRREEEGGRGCVYAREWLGEIVQGESTWGLIPSNLAHHRHPTADLPNMVSVTPLILHSSFGLVTQLTDRDPSTPPTPFATQFLFSFSFTSSSAYSPVCYHFLQFQFVPLFAFLPYSLGTFFPIIS